MTAEEEKDLELLVRDMKNWGLNLGKTAEEEREGIRKLMGVAPSFTKGYLDELKALNAIEECRFQELRVSLRGFSPTVADLYENMFTPEQRKVFDYQWLYGRDSPNITKRTGMEQSTIELHRKTIESYIRQNAPVIFRELLSGEESSYCRALARALLGYHDASA